MRTVFVGPSLPDAAELAGTGVEIRPPACQGDVVRAVEDGAQVIGLIDGQFEFVAPVWHKELLFALSKGVAVFGSASMGALRAAECAPYGMVGIGQIARDYSAGLRIDDADVALLHGPAELNYPALTVPLVNVDATLACAGALGLVPDAQLREIAKAARTIFFKDRVWKRIAAASGIEWKTVEMIVARAWTDQKRLDAIELLGAVRASMVPGIRPSDWDFNATPLWRKMYPRH